MPDEWMERGQVPGQALTAFSEGACPVHRDQVLEPGTVRVLGRDHPAGWCEACRCWWHVGPDGFMPAGCLVATWYTGGRRSGPAAANLGAGGLAVARPGSWWTGVRLRLARWIEPEPDPGEAWCVGCSLNGGRTAVVSAAGHEEHAQLHAAGGVTEVIAIRVNWPDP